MKKILIVILCGVLILGLTACKRKTNNNENSSYESESIIYNFTDADLVEITSIFDNVGNWVKTKSNKYYIGGSNLQDLYSEMKEIESTNLFAKQFIEKADQINLNELNNLELDVLDTYIKLLFIELHDSPTLPIKKFQDIGKVTKVYINNYDENFDTSDEKYYRILYCYFEKKSYWTETISKDGDNDDKLTAIYEEVTLGEDDYKTIEIDNSIINNIIDNNSIFLDFLVSYRDNIYLKVIEERVEKQEKYKLDNVKKEPTIGMSKLEVEKSTWGKPDKINKDTYSWGTTEQWVYNKHGYIYFENGIVTSISER